MELRNIVRVAVVSGFHSLRQESWVLGRLKPVIFGSGLMSKEPSVTFRDFSEESGVMQS